MYDSAKYLIHADIRASGVVERSDVVGAVFGQTEGLLGDELDLRDLQESDKLGRIDVEIESERGSSFGKITIASGLDRVETAILAAGLESIDRVGPCRADVEVSDIEDVRSAKRRQIVERAKELLAEFDDTTLSSDELVEEVRRSVEVEDITEFHGLPAGPRVAESDAVVVVEGRSDVTTLLAYGVKNAIAVEGTDVSDAVADLTRDRTVTAFLDGDRGGDLILKELAQVGDIDYVALAPTDRSVEDLSRGEVMSSLRDKVPFDSISDDGGVTGLAATDGSTQPAPPETSDTPAGTDAPSTAGPDPGDPEVVEARSESEPTEAGPDSASDPPDDTVTDPTDGPVTASSTREAAAIESGESDERDDDAASGSAVDSSDESDPGSKDDSAASDAESADESAVAETLAEHVRQVIGERSGRARLLDGDFELLSDGPAEDAFDLVERADPVPATVVVDAALSQRVLDVAAQRGVDQIVARAEGEFVKRPTGVRIRTADEV